MTVLRFRFLNSYAYCFRYIRREHAGPHRANFRPKNKVITSVLKVLRPNNLLDIASQTVFYHNTCHISVLRRLLGRNIGTDSNIRPSYRITQGKLA